MTDLFADQLVGPLLQREGGATFTNRAADHGGPTRWGVDAKTLGAYRKLGRDATAAEVAALERPEAVEIYRSRFWVEPGFDKVATVSALIAEELFDSGVNLGPSWPAQWLQRSLNLCNQRGQLFPDLKPDGHLGDVTVGALRIFLKARPNDGTKVMLNCLNGFQFGRYVAITEAGGPNSDQESNWCGWIAQRVGFAA